MPKILICDDDKSIVSFLKASLEFEGYAVVSTTDSREVLKLVLREKPDAVILDFYMPGKGGLDVLAELRGNPATRSLPVLMLTGADRMENVEDAFSRGATGYITKPCDPDRLQKKVAAVLAPKPS